jgi:hypothetical protein
MDVRGRDLGMGGKDSGRWLERSVPDARLDEFRHRIHATLTQE